MVVIYYTSTSFMDTVPEIIRSFNRQVTLHVVIEISSQNKNATNIHVDNLDGLGPVEDPERVLGAEQWALFKPYFEGVASVKFVVHQRKQSLSLHSLRIAWKLSRYLKKLKADIVHFDTISPRAIGLWPYLSSKKVVITLHDPIPHSGEDNWREDLPIWIFFRMARSFIFYSEFAADQFRKHYTHIKAGVYTIRMQPLTFTRHFIHGDQPKADCILFFGRVSYYKGIDILIEAIPQVLARFPQEKFIIAGKPSFGYQVDLTPVAAHQANIELLTRFLTTEEMVALIRRAKFIVCPYREATQSGVVMTSYAVGKMVIATRVGSFAEYVEDGQNGLLSEPDPVSLAGKIIEALELERYLELEKKVNPDFSVETGNKNADAIIQAYKHALSDTTTDSKKVT